MSGSKENHFSIKIPDIGECIWYKKPRMKGQYKAEYRWANGIWLGIREESGEHIIGTENGVVKCRADRRKGSDIERWNFEELSKLKGLPWEPIPGRGMIDIKVSIDDGSQDREVFDREKEHKSKSVKKGFWIEAEDVQISGLVGEIVNANRSKVSVIGVKVANPSSKQESRNIVV